MERFSKLWSLKLNDFGRGMIIAALSAPIGILYEWATATNFQLDWHSLIKGPVAGGMAYLIKNLCTGGNGKLLSNK